jgi:hypothetical protein
MGAARKNVFLLFPLLLPNCSQDENEKIKLFARISFASKHHLPASCSSPERVRTAAA